MSGSLGQRSPPPERARCHPPDRIWAPCAPAEAVLALSDYMGDPTELLSEGLPCIRYT
jgi:hypothetical protein